MNKVHNTLFPFLLLLNIASSAQVDSIPPEVKPFFITGYVPLDYIRKDLNGDKKMDAMLVLKHPDEDSSMDLETPRPLLILIRQSNGKLKQVVRNDNAIMCRHCGGVFGDPYEGITVHPNGFSIHFYGGSSWRWAYEYKFVYRPLKKNWYQVSESELNFQSGDPEATMKETTILEAELGETSIQKFTTNIDYQDAQWKVVVAKTYFYDNPKLGSKPRKGYLIRDNIVTGIRQLKNFVLVSYDDGKNNITSGFVLKRELQRLPQ